MIMGTLNTLRTAVTASAVAAALVGCSSGGGDTSASDRAGPGTNGSFLFVDSPTYYFGTTNVGTDRTQAIELVNRGGDVYPIEAINIIGDNREEFTSDFHGPVTLNPSEAVRLHVTFQPVSDGRKFANIDIDFDTIVQVTDRQNQLEQKYYAANESERKQDYGAARKQYSEYVSSSPAVDVNKRRAAIKLPVINEAKNYSEGNDFKGYLNAMNARDAGDYDAALGQIDQIMIAESDGVFADDSLYLKGYIELIDTKDYAAAQETMEQLRRSYPDTTYYDTALYSEALALQSLGNDALATEILLDLRYKHTGIEAFGLSMPKDNVLSRVWFDRASTALEQMGAL